MNNKKRFRVDFEKMAVSVIVGVFLLVITTIMISESRMVSALVFFLLSFVYLREALKNAPVVSFDTQGVSETLSGRCLRKIGWDEIAEIGIIGTKVFNRRNPEKTGRMYLYFSREAFDENDRFELMLKWPSRHMIYLPYGEEQIEQLRSVWNGKIETYNVGDLRL